MYRGSYGEQVIADGALAYWPLGEGATDTDHSGNGHDLTWTGTTPTSAQMLGFPGGATMAGDALGRNPAATTDSWANSAVTIEAWVDTTSTADMCVVSLRNSNNHYALYHDNTDGLRLVIGESTGLFAGSYPTLVFVNDGAIHHVAITWDTNDYELFVDGALADSGVVIDYSPSLFNDYVTVGSEAGPSRRWDGGLAHVALYPTRLSSVQAAIHNTLGRL